MFPSFFADAPTIRMIDPLAEFLGASECGRLDYRYEDAVRLAGHSCPTVASAFLMTRLALRTLYADGFPVRGEIRVDLPDAPDAGVTGVIAAVAALVTGASAETGFRGLGGYFNRRDKLFFYQAQLPGSLGLTRLDSGHRVTVTANLSLVPGDPRTATLLQKCLTSTADRTERTLFRSLWQDRVRRLLLEHADDAAVFLITEDSN
jgi:hypothetical protein